MPTYKRSDMLTRAIDSVLEQSYKNIEIIVVDDNNPNTEWREQSSMIMKQYENDKRVRYICHDKNMNGSVARNTGINSALGELLTFLDDDDWYYPEKVKKQVDFLLENPQYRAVYCGWRRDETDIIPNYSNDKSYGILSGTNIIITNSIMMWCIDAKNCGGFDPVFKRHQEAVFLLRYIRIGGTIGALNKVLVGFDTSDRLNEPTPQKDEEYNFQLLNAFKDMIDSCETRKTGAKKEIYIKRFKIIFIKYVKSKQLGCAFSLYIKMLKIAPIGFTSTIIKYTIERFL